MARCGPGVLLGVTQRQQFRATDHTLERFRDRVERKHAGLDKEALTRLLSDRIWYEALYVRTVRDPRKPDEPTTLYLLARPDGYPYVCVVRDYAVVTILEAWMADNNFPGWREDTQPLIVPATSAYR
jgi:hypothetical protein